MDLKRTTGHECRQCGCTHQHPIERVRIFGTEYQRFSCDHCGQMSERAVTEIEAEERERREQSDIDAIPRWPRTRCPRCGSSDVPVRSTLDRMRRHRCRCCGHTFKSIERE